MKHGRTGLAIALAAGLTAPLSIVGVASAAPEDEQASVLESDQMQVRVAHDFPRAISYELDGATMHGRAKPLDTVTLNGTDYRVETTFRGIDGSSANYTMAVPKADGVELDARLSVRQNRLSFEITEVREDGDFRVGTMAIPNHDLVSVRSTDPSAQVAAAKVDLAVDENADRIYPVTADTEPNAKPRGSTYTLVSTGDVAAALETNSVYDEPTGQANDDNGHIWRQARERGNQVEVGVWSGQWTYRPAGADESATEPLPKVTIGLTAERNDDDAVDWQDAAIELRDFMYEPEGAQKTRNRVVQRIPFNIASMATHPFLRTLDDTKRISLATDGLPQMVLLKGYQSEGHDAAHPDYGGHYNERAGGLDGLNRLLDEGTDWNADFGVHVNATESYPEANAFDEQLVDPDDPQWAWMDQSYRIDQRRDLNTGGVVDRFGQLADETDGQLDFLYLDVFRESGWLADGLARDLRRMDFEVATEWSHRFVRDAVWTHWSADPDYGGDDLTGINSRILRFLQNHQRDVYIPDDLLGSAQIVDFEGWTGEVDYDAFLRNVWKRNLPTKFLQHFPIRRWKQDEIALAGDVRVSKTGGSRQYHIGESTVLDGDAYLLPWSPTDPTKLYHYNADGGSTTWEVPEPFADRDTLRLYRLTDTGRKPAGKVEVTDGSVTLDASANTAYVLYPEAPEGGLEPRYGAGTPIDDPGFDSGTLAPHWKLEEGAADAAAVERNDRGQFEAVIDGEDETALAQRTSPLASGSYALSASVEVEPGKQRTTRLRVNVRGTDETEQTVLRSSPLTNTTASDEKRGTNAQRIRTFFDVPVGKHPVDLELRANAGNAEVRVDDVRVVPMRAPTSDEHARADNEAVEQSKEVTSWDFEDVDAGWGPFYRGGDAEAGDARTHLAEKNAPYTQQGWNGKAIDDVLEGQWSLKSMEYQDHLAYRTLPASVRFQPGHRYRVEFDYESEAAGAYAWVRGVDGANGSEQIARTTLKKQQDPTRFTSEFVVGDCGPSWVGLRRLASDVEGQQEFSLDNFSVIDLGEADEPPDCE